MSWVTLRYRPPVFTQSLISPLCPVWHYRGRRVRYERHRVGGSFTAAPPRSINGWVSPLATYGTQDGIYPHTEDVHLDSDSPRLEIRESKFRKSRLVPLHPTTAEKLRHYARLRTQLGGELSSKAFFISERQEYLCYETLRSWFFRTSLD